MESGQTFFTRVYFEQAIAQNEKPTKKGAYNNRYFTKPEEVVVVDGVNLSRSWGMQLSSNNIPY